MRKKSFRVIFMLLCITGGFVILVKTHSSTQINQVERVLTILLNAPDDDIKEMYGSLFDQVVDSEASSLKDTAILMELNENNARQILTQKFENSVTEDFITRCLVMDDFMLLQYLAIVNETYVNINRLTITETQHIDQISYEAALQIFGKGIARQEILVFGQVQLDNTGKVNAITMRGKELNQLYQSQIENNY